MSNCICSNCGTPTYYDGRCGDSHILMCNCDKGRWINDGRGGYYDNPRNAHPIPSDEAEYDHSWDNDRR